MKMTLVELSPADNSSEKAPASKMSLRRFKSLGITSGKVLSKSDFDSRVAFSAKALIFCSLTFLVSSIFSLTYFFFFVTSSSFFRIISPVICLGAGSKLQLFS